MTLLELLKEARRQEIQEIREEIRITEMNRDVELGLKAIRRLKAKQEVKQVAHDLRIPQAQVEELKSLLEL